MKFIPILLIAIAIYACGDAPAGDEQSEPIVTVQFADKDGQVLSPSSATESTSTLPATIIVTLVGPDGARSVESDFESGKLQVGSLSEGTWSIRGDGLSEDGNALWEAPVTKFQVKAGEETRISLTFKPVE